MKIPLNLILSAVLFQVFACEALPAGAPASKPNIVFFLVDDLGQRDVGCYGSQFYETPAIDQLLISVAVAVGHHPDCPSPTPVSTVGPPRTTDFFKLLRKNSKRGDAKYMDA